MRLKTLLVLTSPVLLGAPRGVTAQDLNIPLPLDSIEFLLRSAPFDLDTLSGTRGAGDRTSQGVLFFDSTTLLQTKFAPAPEGGEDGFNNVPSHEVAAYELARMFLDDSEVVVPPTVMRALPLDWYLRYDPRVEQTFREAASVVTVLQSFVLGVTAEGVWDEDRFDADTRYARHWANMNLLTYLIYHSDSNTGNLLISRFESNPRIFSVDNGVAFGTTIDSDRGTRWRRLIVDRFPASTVTRLGALTEEELRQRLGVLAQWRIENGLLEPETPTENIDSRSRVRERDGVVQFGLTRGEIDDIWYRLEEFLGYVRNGRYRLF